MLFAVFLLYCPMKLNVFRFFSFFELVIATRPVHQIICVTSWVASAPAESRPAVVNVIFALQRTGDFQRVNHVFVITTRPLVIPRPGNVLTVSTALRENTVKFALLVTMVMPHVVSHDHRRHMLSSVRHQAPYQILLASGTSQRNNAFCLGFFFNFICHLLYNLVF